MIRQLKTSMLKNRNISKNKIIAQFNDQLGEQISTHGFYEIFYMSNILPYFDKQVFSNLMLDIGANIGNHSVYFSNYFRNIYSFEPQKLTFKILEINTNHLSNIKIFNYGVSTNKTEKDIYVNLNNRGMISDEKLDENYVKESVQFSPHTFKNEEIISYIKIDVEGNEVDVLSSLKEKIIEDQPIISFEYNDGYTKENIKSLFKKMGYTDFFVFNRDYLQRNSRKLFMKNPHKLRKINLEKTDDYGMVFTHCVNSKFKLKNLKIL